MAGSMERLKELEAENARLQRENLELNRRLTGKSAPARRHTADGLAKKTGSVICVILAVILLFVGNLLFWTGNTIVKSDRYVEATAPIIRNSQVQSALAYNINQKLYQNVDIDQLISGALPPRAAFLAPTISDQVKQHSETAIQKILQRPQFQERWNTAQQNAHDRFIKLVKEHGSDGSIDIGEVYSDVSQQLKGTKLSFLADKPLPPKIGNIQLVTGTWLSVLQKTINNIDTWRFMAICLLIVFGFLGVWLSRRRRRTVEILGGLFAGSMLITIILLKLLRQSIAGRVDPHYSSAVQQTFSIVTHSLQVQTLTLMFAALLVILIAWISGGSASGRAVRSGVDRLFSGNVHAAIFSHGENGLTRWIGAYKNLLQWLVVIVVAASVLFVRLTPGVLLVQVLIILVLVLAVQVIAAKPSRR